MLRAVNDYYQTSACKMTYNTGNQIIIVLRCIENSKKERLAENSTSTSASGILITTTETYTKHYNRFFSVNLEQYSMQLYAITHAFVYDSLL